MNTTKQRGRANHLELFPNAAAGITEQLRQAIEESGLSAYRLAADSGVNVATVLRFKNGERSLSLSSVDGLCRVLGLELVKRKGK